jgi:NADH:ubiquinone reductase (H+-translocating)
MMGTMRSPTRILVLGGGYVGLYTCLGLQRALGKEAEITLVSTESFMQYQPFLPEAAGGNIEPRHVVVPLRRTLKRTKVIVGTATGLDHEARIVRVKPTEGPDIELSYDQVVVGLGSVSRVLPVPGLAEQAIGFKSISEAIYLRNRVLSRIDLAETTTDPKIRKKALTFLFVGGGYAGVEALAELEDLARDATRYYRNVSRSDMTWFLVEATGAILPEIGPKLASMALRRLRERDIDVRLNTRLESATDGVMRLSDGTRFEAETLVWTTGVKAHPLTIKTGFPLDEKQRIVVDRFLRVQDVENAWAAGDCSAVPDLDLGGTNPPSAQHALRQARCLAKNIAASVRGDPMKEYRYKNKGGLVSLGRYKGVARVMGLRLHGFPAWFVHRTYHVLLIPTMNRKVRVLVDWTVALFFKRDIVQLGSLTEPRDPFAQAFGEPEPRSPETHD